MERITFIVQDNQERHLSCLLNPETLTMRRWAGVETRQSIGGIVTNGTMADSPFIHTGGGVTELNLDLLFDVEVAGSSMQTKDVRDLTAPFWELAENMTGKDGYQKLAQVRLVWGKNWNIPGIIAAVAERFDRFTSSGIPRRSWFRLRFLRTMKVADAAGVTMQHRNFAMPQRREDVNEKEISVHHTTANERLDVIAHRYLGDSSLWRYIAWFNNLSNPISIDGGVVLKIPSLNYMKNNK